jgi:hypothetical protein
MGEGADRVRDGSPRPEEVAGEIDVLRNELGGLVAELDRRRHEAFDVRLQASRHPLVVAGIATVVALMVGGAIALVVREARHRRSPTARARDVRAALARVASHPRRVAAEPSVAYRLATAAGVALVSAFAKRLVERSVRPAGPPKAAPGR